MFERSKKNFPSKKQLIEQFILMMAIILFIVGFTAVFGSENVLIGVVVATGILMFKDMDMGYQPRVGFWICWLIYILIPIVIYINGLNAYLGVVLNIAFVYLIMMLTQRDVYDAN